METKMCVEKREVADNYLAAFLLTRGNRVEPSGKREGMVCFMAEGPNLSRDIMDYHQTSVTVGVAAFCSAIRSIKSMVVEYKLQNW